MIIIKSPMTKANDYRNKMFIFLMQSSNMSFASLLLFLCVVNLLTVYGQKPEKLDYCALHERNTPCVYDCMRSSRCGDTGSSFQTFDDEMRNYLTYWMNVFRNRVSHGESRVLQPNLKLFPQISYDKECEFIAACFAKQCLTHPDKVRIALDGTHLGQLRATISTMPNRTNLEEAWKETLVFRLMQIWWDQHFLYKREFTPTLHESYVPVIYPYKTNAFTQIIWENTSYFGCALMESKRHTVLHTFELICTFKPAGNIIGHKVYEINNTKPEKCTKPMFAQYNFCIETLRPLEKDTYIPPMDLNSTTNRKFTIVLMVFVLSFGFHIQMLRNIM